MSQRRSLTCFQIILLAAFTVACLGLLAFTLGGLAIPRMAEAAYGPPSPNLAPLAQTKLAAEILMSQDDLRSPVDPAGVPQTFEIELGEPVYSVAQRLESAGLIRNPSAFQSYLVYKGLDTSLQAGVFELSPAMNAVELAQEMQDATPEDVTFNILAGWRVEEIAAALPTSGLGINPDEFLRLVRSAPGEALPAGWTPGMNVEGYLAPGSYQIPRDATAVDLVRFFTQAFDENLDSATRTGFESQGLSLAEAVILASIVEREAVVADEQQQIASVFLNRLAVGMKLDSDPTVQYAVGYNESRQTWWTVPLSLADLQKDSPYNTYLYAGLPPGPICNPSIGALRAVADPVQTPYYYFRAACDGSGRHNFAVSYEEHIQNACP